MLNKIDYTEITRDELIFKLNDKDKQINSVIKSRDKYKAQLKTYTHGIPAVNAKKGPVYAIEKFDGSIRIGWIDHWITGLVIWVDQNSDEIEIADIKRVFPLPTTEQGGKAND